MPSMLRIAFLLSLTVVACASFRAEWIQKSPSATIQPRRSGHIPFLDHQGVPFVFGGYLEEDTGDPETPYRRYVENDLWKWTKESWQRVETTGDTPVGRLVAAAAVVDGTMYLIGGWNSDAKDPSAIFLDTVHALDLESMAWRSLEAKIPDGPSSRHVAVALPNEKILVHHHRCADFVWLLDPVKDEFVQQETTGPCPSSRGLQAGCMLPGTNQFVLFGGAAQDGTMSNEAFVLNTDTWEWKDLSSNNNKDESSAPCPRAAPCMCAVDESHVVLYGGARATEQGLEPLGDVWLLSLNEKDGGWTCLIKATDPSAPPARNAASLWQISESANTKEFLLAGGWAPFRETWDDCYVLRLVKGKED